MHLVTSRSFRHKSDFYSPKIPIFLHTCATSSELPYRYHNVHIWLTSNVVFITNNWRTGVVDSPEQRNLITGSVPWLTRSGLGKVRWSTSSSRVSRQRSLPTSCIPVIVINHHASLSLSLSRANVTQVLVPLSSQWSEGSISALSLAFFLNIFFSRKLIL